MVFFPMSQPVPSYLVALHWETRFRGSWARVGGRSPAGRAGVTPESGAAWGLAPRVGAFGGGLLLSACPAPHPVSAVALGATAQAAALTSCSVRLGLRRSRWTARSGVPRVQRCRHERPGGGGSTQGGEGAVPGPALSPCRLWGPDRAGYRPQAPWLGLWHLQDHGPPSRVHWHLCPTHTQSSTSLDGPAPRFQKGPSS